MEFSHFNESGRAKMVNVSLKENTLRKAVAKGHVLMKPKTLALIKNGEISKGDVFAVAQVAGVMAAKKTSDLIPMCHPLMLTGVDLEFVLNEEKNIVEIIARVDNFGQTGVEMEALTAVSVAALTIYDMCKSIDKGIVISEIALLYKSGGKSGIYKKE